MARRLKLQGIPDSWPGSEKEPAGRSGWWERSGRSFKVAICDFKEFGISSGDYDLRAPDNRKKIVKNRKRLRFSAGLKMALLLGLEGKNIIKKWPDVLAAGSDGRQGIKSNSQTLFQIGISNYGRQGINRAGLAAFIGVRVLNQISKRLLILRTSAKLPGSVFHGQDGSGQIENKHF